MINLAAPILLRAYLHPPAAGHDFKEIIETSEFPNYCPKKEVFLLFNTNR